MKINIIIFSSSQYVLTRKKRITSRSLIFPANNSSNVLVLRVFYRPSHKCAGNVETASLSAPNDDVDDVISHKYSSKYSNIPLTSLPVIARALQKNRLFYVLYSAAKTPRPSGIEESSTQNFNNMLLLNFFGLEQPQKPLPILICFFIKFIFAAYLTAQIWLNHNYILSIIIKTICMAVHYLHYLLPYLVLSSLLILRCA